MTDASRLFCGHRALGYVSNSVPLVSRYVRRRRENLIVTCVGRSFHTYGGLKLGLLSVSKIHPEDIRTLAADTYMVYSACGTTIYAWRRGCELKHTYTGHKKPVVLLLPFGPSLISVDTKSFVKIWDIKSGECRTELEFPSKSFAITAICHPPTYKDKILLGSRQGALQLWNVKTCKKIYKFSGWDSSVLCLEPCPSVLDAVAVGLQSGQIVILNILYDEEYISLKQDWGPVSCLSFRSDRSDLLVSGSGHSGFGHIAVWDLNEKKLAAQMRDAHCDKVTGLRCMPQEPILVTSSPDNTIKQWIFDMPDGGGRLLRIKEGHAQPPTKIRFYGALGTNILSAAEDSSLRVFSTVTDLLNKSLGVASFNRKLSKKHKQIENPVKMEPIIDFTSETTREQEWDNIGCVHRNTTTVTTWSYGKQKMGMLKLRHQRFKDCPELRQSLSTCICLSMCGNFVIIGYDSGYVDKYNIQSGIHRGSLSHPEAGGPAHARASIRGICSDGLNQAIITGDCKGVLRFWRFSDNSKLGKDLKLESPVFKMELHRPSSLLAVALSDFSLQIIDIVAKKVIRIFEGHDDQLTDVAFSQDARWLISSALDATLKVWDVPSGNLIDAVQFPRAVTSLTMSPQSDFMATSHLGDLGIYLWTNVSLYKHLSLKALPEDYVPKKIQMPTVKQSQEEILAGALDSMDIDDVKEDEEIEEWDVAQVHDDMVTLANLPESRWQNLLHLDVIKARNKPKAAPEKPKDAPFFLPTITGPDGQTRFDLKSDEDDDTDKSRQLKNLTNLLGPSYTQFGQRLMASNDLDTDCDSIIELLKSKGPSAIEIELTSLSPEGGGSLEAMHRFLDFVHSVLKSRRNFEAAQAYLGLFLKLHSDVILTQADMVSTIAKINEEQVKSWSDLKSELSASSALVAFYKSSLVS